MSVNFTGLDDHVTFVINPAIHVSLFVVDLPVFVLITLTVIAVLLTKDLNINLRIIFLNVFAADISTLIGAGIVSLSNPFRVHNESEVDYTCALASSAIFAAKLFSTSLYAVVVFIFIKYGAKKLKCSIIVLSIVFTWALCILASTALYTSLYAPENNYGLCFLNIQSALFLTLSAISLLLLFMVGLGITILFGIFTFCYVKKNTLEESTDTHEAVVKILVYVIVGTVISLINTLVPTVLSASVKILNQRPLLALVLYTLTGVVFIFSLMLYPVVTLIFLRSVHATVIKIVTLCFCCRQPLETSPDVEQEIQPAPRIVHQLD